MAENGTGHPVVAKPDVTQAELKCLLAILKLSEAEGCAATNKIARELQVKPPTVCRILDNLLAAHLITKVPYGKIELTLQGKRTANRLSNRILYGGTEAYANLAAAFTGVSAYAFLVFNLLCAPCFAAIGAIRREMNNAGWTWFAIGYQCGFAYAVALMINQFGKLFTGSADIIGVIAAAVVLAVMVYMLFFKKYQEATRLTREV